jgi:hypothetical protein
MYPQHELKFKGFVAALSQIVVRLDYPHPLAPWDDTFQLLQKVFLFRLGLRQFIA